MSNIIITQVAQSVPFDNSTNGFTADNVQNAIEEAKNSSSGSSLIPEVTSDPVSAVAGQTWVLKTINATPIGLLLTLTTLVGETYQLSYKTISGSIKRTSLT